jgi:CRP/FNR family transcriptional regulator, cyclic AMP receptor protein
MVLLDMLEDIAFLHDLSAGSLNSIASAGQLKEYPPHTLLFREGEKHPYIYLVSRGNVAVEILGSDGEAMTIQTVGPGELLGWSPVLEAGPMTATARTLSRCRVVALAADRMLALCAHDPRFGMEFIRRTAAALARRLDATRRRLPSAVLRGLPGACAETGPA